MQSALRNAAAAAAAKKRKDYRALSFKPKQLRLLYLSNLSLCPDYATTIVPI